MDSLHFKGGSFCFGNQTIEKTKDLNIIIISKNGSTKNQVLIKFFLTSSYKDKKINIYIIHK